MLKIQLCMNKSIITVVLKLQFTILLFLLYFLSVYASLVSIIHLFEKRLHFDK